MRTPDRIGICGTHAAPARFAALHAPHHGHSHGLVDDSIKRSRAGLRAVGVSLAVLGGDRGDPGRNLRRDRQRRAARRPDPQLRRRRSPRSRSATAFLLRSAKAERCAGLAVVARDLRQRLRRRRLRDREADQPARPRPPARARRSRAPSASPATSSPRRSGSAPAGGWTAPPWSPTATTPAPTASSASA